MTTTRATVTALALAAAAALLVTPAGAADTEGEVIAVRGTIIDIFIRSGPKPAVGDTVSVMHPVDANGNATPIGNWEVTEVSGNLVKASLVRSYGGQPSVGLLAYFSSSRGPGFREGPDVSVPGTTSSGVPGKVTEVRGKNVTIQLEREAAPAVGDRVELSYSAGEDTISVGTWRVSGVRADGRVDAEPEEALGQPTPRMDALVFATGTAAPPPTPDTTAHPTRADDLFSEASSIQSKDAARAVALFEQAAAMGHARAAEKAALAYEAGRGVPQDDARAFKLFRQAAEAGLPTSQNFYGSFFGTGRAVAEDQAQAVYWFRKAAAQGDSYAQSNLCLRYKSGNGVEIDLEESLRWCRLSAEQNNPVALNQMGWRYQHGMAVDKDLDKAFEYYLRAAELGHDNGQNNTGYCYEKGWGVTRDYERARYWYGQAASQGWSFGDWNLGRMYFEGIGVSPDRAKAVEHWQRAARAGHSRAQEKLQELGQTW
jgi:TPR repeat protein